MLGLMLLGGKVKLINLKRAVMTDSFELICDSKWNGDFRQVSTQLQHRKVIGGDPCPSERPYPVTGECDADLRSDLGGAL
jgi:hypothetical protein